MRTITVGRYCSQPPLILCVQSSLASRVSLILNRFIGTRIEALLNMHAKTLFAALTLTCASVVSALYGDQGAQEACAAGHASGVLLCVSF